jgi:predicted aspartyl protease
MAIELNIYRFVVFIFLSFCCVSFLHAENTYFIGRDAGGVYLQTDNYGSWYIDKDDAGKFEIGEKGLFKIGVDHTGNFIMIDNRKKFYTDLEARESIARQLRENDRLLSQLTGQIETTIIIRDNQILLPVTLGYRSSETTVLLLLDTGASITVLHGNVANNLAIQQMTPSVLFSAEGHRIESRLAQLSYIKVGPLKKENVLVSIIEHKDPSVERQGLLGMNFLRNFEYQIDFKRRKIIWKDEVSTYLTPISHKQHGKE